MIEVAREHTVDRRHLRLARQRQQREGPVAVVARERRGKRFSLLHDRIAQVAAKNLLDGLPGVIGVLGVSRFTPGRPDRKSTRLNSSHSQISYAVFCLKKKKTKP